MPSVINIALKPRITEESLLQLGFKRTIFFEGVIQFVEDLLSILADTKVIGESVRVWIRLEHLDVHCTVEVLGKLGPERFFAANWAPANRTQPFPNPVPEGSTDTLQPSPIVGRIYPIPISVQGKAITFLADFLVT